MDSIRWCPKLFAAVGAGFQGDATVRDGVHLRWSLDPRMGLPRSPRDKGFEIAFSRTKEGSITRVDLFQPSVLYPVRSNKTLLPAGPGTIYRDAESLGFLRPLEGTEWLPYWRYRHNRTQVDALMMGRDEAEKAVLDYLDGVMAALDPIGPVSFSRQEEVVAVDVRFLAPAMSRGGSGPPIQPNPFLSLNPVSRRTSGIGGPSFDLFHAQRFATVQGFDSCKRIVAEDWVGRHPQIIRGPRTVPFPAANSLKLTARLRAPGIRWIRILRAPGYAGLAEDEIRWVFCDDYASARGVWAAIAEEVMESAAADYTQNTLQDDIYAPFHAAALPNDWADMADRLRTHFINAPEIRGLLLAHDTFETATFAALIKDLEAPTHSSDDAVALPLLAALQAGAVDPIVARIFGLYGFVPTQQSPGEARDWRVLVRPPFGSEDNLDRLDKRLRAILDPGRHFFHDPGDSIGDLALAGLVLDAAETTKPPPPDAHPDVHADVRLVPAKPDTFDHLVRATITAAPERSETRPWMVNASYEVIRGLSGEPAMNVMDDAEAGPLDDIGILPNIVIPEFNRETCLSTGRVIDLFARDATEDRQLAYLVRGFDVFGRPSNPVATAPIDLPAACLLPQPPGSVSARVTRGGEMLTMTVDFDLGQVRRTVEAEWQALETLVHTVPLTEGVKPEDASWTGTRPGRLVELAFNPISLELQVAPVQQSCLALAWAAGTLQRLADSTNSCTSTFPGVADVAPLSLTTLEPGRRAYRMTIGLGARSQYPNGFNAWCARLRLRGRCTRSGQVVHSPELTVRAHLLLPTLPPPVTQPLVEALPLSTYPDSFGTSYFSIDLRNVLSPANQTPDTLVKVYLGRLEAMTDRPQDFVEDETVIDPPGLIALAKLSLGRFSLVSDPPEAFDPNRPHVEIAVPGNLSEVYVAAVQGVDGVLEGGSWQRAAFLPFRTPPLRALPLVEWTSAEVEAHESGLNGRFAVTARFPAPIPDPTRPPILQLFRRDLSTGQAGARFVTVAEGQSADPAAVSPEYTFALEDGPLADCHRYDYAVQLLAYAPWRGQHVKVGDRVPREVAAPYGSLDDPFAEPTALTVTASSAGGFDIGVAFAAGDFTIELEKEPDSGVASAWLARIEGGRLFLPDGITGTLTTGPTYDLRLADPDPALGLYRVRLRSGQALTVSREARTP